MTDHTTASSSTVKSLARQGAQLGRRQRAATSIIAAMRGGAALQLHFAASGPAWMLTDGTRVHDEVAKLVINHPDIIGCGDGLFRGLVSQTFRYAAG